MTTKEEIKKHIEQARHEGFHAGYDECRGDFGISDDDLEDRGIWKKYEYDTPGGCTGC